MLRKLRIALATISFLTLSVLFLDCSGSLQGYLNWMARIQAVPAVLALNVGIIAALILATLLLGRVYCSIICPWGVIVDSWAWLGRKSRKNRYGHSKPMTWLRVAMLVVFIASTIAGVSVVTTLLDTYSTFGLVAVWKKTILTASFAAVFFAIIGLLSWFNGRTYCNTICPVGTVLGFLSKFSMFKVVIDESKCTKCTLCEKNCKASCIDAKGGLIDYSRCVTCFDCVGKCSHGAIGYKFSWRGKRPERETSPEVPRTDNSRRAFMTTSALLAGSIAAKAQNNPVVKLDGGLKALVPKQEPDRVVPLVPAGAKSLRHLSQHCVGCQLCISACPSGVLKPSKDLKSLLQPYLSYKDGWCRFDCNVCSNTCPTGAIAPVNEEENSSVQIGYAVFDRDRCVVLSDKVSCGNCARHCPAGAIKMVKVDENDNGKGALRIPLVNTERCIGCGACEYHCPSRPLSAIHVRGIEVHKSI